jgi:DNA primase
VLERIRAVATRKSRTTALGGRKDASGGALPDRARVPSVSGIDGPSEVVAGNRFERRIIAMMLQFPEILPEINKLNVLKYFENDDLKSVGSMILKLNPTTADQISELISRIENEAQHTLIAALAIEDESWNKKGCLRLLGKFVDTRQKLRNSGVLDAQIKAAEKRNDHDLLLTLLNKKQKMAVLSEKQKMAILSEK